MRRFECNGFVCLLGALAGAVLAGCGGSTAATATPPRSGTAVFSNASDGSHSAVYDGTNFVVGLLSLDKSVPGSTSTPIGAVLVDTAGAAVGSPLVLAEVGESPSIACDGGGICLLAWDSAGDLASEGSIKGQLVTTTSSDISASGPAFTIQAASNSNMDGSTDRYELERQSIDWDGNNFFVVYTHVHQPAPNTGPSTSDVWGQFVSRTGSGIVDAPIAISDTAGQKSGDRTGQAVVAYVSGPAKFLVAWNDATRNATVDGDLCVPTTMNQQYAPTDVEAQYVTQSSTSAGTLSGTNFPIVQDSTRKIRNGPTIGWGNPSYLLVWNNETTPGPCPNMESPDDGPSVLTAAFLPFSGTTPGIPIALGSNATQGALAQAVYDPTSDSFVVVWTDLRNDANGDFICDAGESACLDIWGLSIPRISKIPGSEKALVSDSGHQFEAILGKGGGKLLLFWIDGAIALGDNGSQNLTSPNVERALVITAP